MRYGWKVQIALTALAVVGMHSGVADAGTLSDLSVRVPEPGTLTLLASGAAALGGLRWLRGRKKK
jgi:hypothetical protein